MAEKKKWTNGKIKQLCFADVREFYESYRLNRTPHLVQISRLHACQLHVCAKRSERHTLALATKEININIAKGQPVDTAYF